LLRGGLERCRGINPLVYSLSDCGIRALCANGQYARNLQMYGWFQHVQTKLSCGGFCDDEVPLFGPASMRDTLTKKQACTEKLSQTVLLLARILGAVAVAAAIPLVVVGIMLACAANDANDDFQEVDLSDPDEASSDDDMYQ